MTELEPMTPEEIKSELKRLFRPIRKLIDERGLAGFLLSDPDTADEMFGATVRPLPDNIKNVLWNYGSIYMVDSEVTEMEQLRIELEKLRNQLGWVRTERDSEKKRAEGLFNDKMDAKTEAETKLAESTRLLGIAREALEFTDSHRDCFGNAASSLVDIRTNARLVLALLSEPALASVPASDGPQRLPDLGHGVADAVEQGDSEEAEG